MRNTVKYEWTLETIEDGDIVDSDFSDTLSFDKGLLHGNDVGLVRNEGNEISGVVSRLWAYVKDGKLPEYFSDANGNETDYKIPVAYKLECGKYFIQPGDKVITNHDVWDIDNPKDPSGTCDNLGKESFIVSKMEWHEPVKANIVYGNKSDKRNREIWYNENDLTILQKG